MIRIAPCFKWYVLLGIMLCSIPSDAQYHDKDFVRYTVKEGLSDNQITGITQDRRGYLWIGTLYGLNRFDGNQFKNYFQGLPEYYQVSATIRRLRSFSNDRLAVITRSGFQVMNCTDGSVQNYFINDSTALRTLRNMVWDVAELSDGSFAVTTSSGFYVVKADGSLSFRHDEYGLEDIGNKRIFYGRDIFKVSDQHLLIYVEESDQVLYHTHQRAFRKILPDETEWKPFSSPTVEEGGPWISKTQISDHEYIFLQREDSIAYYDHARKKRTVSPLPFNWSDEFTWESKVTVLNDSTFAINSGYDGLHFYHLNRRSGKITCDPNKVLAGYKVNCLFWDSDRRMWVGTSSGLLRQTISPSRINRYEWPIEEKQNFGYVDALMYKGALYLGRYARNAGLLIVDSASMKAVQEIAFYSINSSWNEVTSMEMYHPDTIWIGTSSGLLWFDIKSHNYGQVMNRNTEPHEVYKLNVLEAPQPDGHAWMLNWLGGQVARYHIPTRTFKVMTMESTPSLPFAKVKSIAYDAYGDVWIGGHSLTRWNHRTQEFDTLISVYGGPNKFDDDIVAMSADPDGSLWLHNAENGLLQYKIKEKQFVSYGLSQGLPSMVLTSLSPVYDHTLFIGSLHHLTRFDTRTHEYEIYGDENDLPEILSFSRKMYIDTANQYGFAFYKNEVVRFPVRHEPPSYQTSELFIHELTVNGDRVIAYPKEGIQFQTNENNLTLNYTVIDLESGNNYQFAYQINQAGNWTSVGEHRTLNLTNLPPDAYMLRVRATGNSGEQKIASFSFSIAPPFWKTGWFISLCALFAAGIAYGISRFRISQIRQKANLDKLLSQSEMKALHAQMNPHFVFNSLNSIREMILNNENTEASRYLSKFAHLIRVTLDQSNEPFISLRHTMDYLNRYIEMEKIRNVHFRFKMDADPLLDLDETILPPMLIQPFIENAIWHGVNGNGKGIDIRVSFEKQQDYLVCRIDDNGIGIRRALDLKKSSENGHQSVGIANIQNRIDLLNKKYHQQSSVMIQDKETLSGHPETGTLITISLPLDMNME